MTCPDFEKGEHKHNQTDPYKLCGTSKRRGFWKRGGEETSGDTTSANRDWLATTGEDLGKTCVGDSGWRIL